MKTRHPWCQTGPVVGDGSSEWTLNKSKNSPIFVDKGLMDKWSQCNDHRTKVWVYEKWKKKKICLWTVTVWNICHKWLIWHIIALSSLSVIYHFFAAKLSIQMAKTGINMALLDEFMPWLKSVTNHKHQRNPLVCPHTSKNLCWMIRRICPSHYALDYRMNMRNSVAQCKLTI